MASHTQHNVSRSVVSSLFGLLLNFMGWIALCWLMALLITIVLIAWHDQEMVLLHGQQLINAELQHFFSNTAVSGLPLIKQQAVNCVFSLQGIASVLPRFMADISTIHNVILQRWIETLSPFVLEILQTLLITTQWILLRLATVLLFIPLILLLGLIGLTDGLVQRYLRRINGGRESALLYHYAKAAIKPCLYWGSLLYVTLPLTLNPAHWLIPCAIASSLAVFLTAKTFKKYI